MKVKENVKNYVMSEKQIDGCDVNDKNCLVASLINKVSDRELKRYKDYVIDKNFIAIVEDNDMIACIDNLFQNNLSIAEASRASFVHRNTLLYRIDKIQRLTGLNLRVFDDALTFKLLMIIYGKINKNK